MTTGNPPPAAQPPATQPAVRVTASDRLWQAAAADLAPDKSLARMNDKAKQVVTSVTLVGTLLAGFGLIAPATLPLPPLARGLAVAAVITAVLAIALALVSLLLRFTPAIRPGNVIEVERWYRSQFHRAYLVVAAGWALLAALAFAAAAAAVTLLNPTPPDPLIVLQTTGTGNDIQVSVHAEVTGRSTQDILRVELAGVAAGTRTVVGASVGRPATNGAAAVTLTTSAFAGYDSAEAVVTVGGLRCTATLAVPPAGSSDGGSVVCAGG